MASRNGSASVVPIPLRIVRRGNDFPIKALPSYGYILAYVKPKRYAGRARPLSAALELFGDNVDFERQQSRAESLTLRIGPQRNRSAAAQGAVQQEI